MPVRYTTSNNVTYLLLTPEEFALLPNGAELESISGEKVTKGVDEIDDDTSCGLLAYGTRVN